MCVSVSMYVCVWELVCVGFFFVSLNKSSAFELSVCCMWLCSVVVFFNCKVRKRRKKGKKPEE